MLELQARSFARFVDPAQVGSIHVIMNDVDEGPLRQRIEPILPAYGALQDKVRILSGDEVLLGAGHCARRPVLDRVLIENRFRIPLIRKGGWRGNNGYRNQQVLKLGAARVAASENMVILDTKNLFLRQFDEAEFFAPGGAARIPFIDIESDFHRNWLLQSLDALGAPRSDPGQIKTTTFATPYPVRRSLVLSLLDEINARYGSVQALFASRRRPSEFMLMNAFCLKSHDGYAPWFEEAESTAIGLWPTYSTEVLTQLLGRLDDSRSLTLGLHNRAIANLPQNLRDRVFHELEARGICDQNRAEAILRQTAALSG